MEDRKTQTQVPLRQVQLTVSIREEPRESCRFIGIGLVHPMIWLDIA